MKCFNFALQVHNFSSRGQGRQETASQSIVAIVRQGRCLSQPVQLIISWGMLNRLRQVLIKKLQVSTSTAELYLATITTYAQLGEALDSSPQLTLGALELCRLKTLKMLMLWKLQYNPRMRCLG